MWGRLEENVRKIWGKFEERREEDLRKDARKTWGRFEEDVRNIWGRLEKRREEDLRKIWGKTWGLEEDLRRNVRKVGGKYEEIWGRLEERRENDLRKIWGKSSMQCCFLGLLLVLISRYVSQDPHADWAHYVTWVGLFSDAV